MENKKITLENFTAKFVSNLFAIDCKEVFIVTGRTPEINKKKCEIWLIESFIWNQHLQIHRINKIHNIQLNKSARTNELCWFKLTLQIISEIHFECHNFIKTGNSEYNPILMSLWHPNRIGLDFGELNNNEISIFHENEFEIIKMGSRRLHSVHGESNN